MQCSIVNYKTIKENSDFRIDAEYFKPTFLELDKKLDGGLICNDLLDYLTDGTHQTPKYSENGVCFLSSGNIEPNYISFDNTKRISTEEHAFLKHCQPQALDILISKSGRIGHAAVVPSEYKKGDFNIYEGIALFRTHNFNPFALSIIINSEIVQEQIKRLQKGVAQPHLHLEDIKNIKIPKLSSSFLEVLKSLSLASFKKRKQSKSLYSQAEQLLLSELGLLNWKPKQELSFVKNFSDTQKAERIDAEYFQPKYEEIVEAIKKYKGGWDLLKKQFTIMNGQTPDKYFEEEKDVQVLKTKQIRNDAIQYDDVVYTNKELALNILKNKDILFASMGVGSLGRTGIFYNFETNKMTSVDGTIKILRQKNVIEPEVLLVYLNSLVGQEYVYRYIVGSTGIISIKNDSIQNLLVPLIELPVQKKIAEWIQKSHETKKLSKSLLEIAKRGVEMAIEKDEKKAERWINNELKKLQVNL